jgi:hypothetical protein
MSWQSDMKSVHVEAGGTMSLDLIEFSDLRPLLAGTNLGSERCANLLQLTIAALQRIDRAPSRKPMLCATCPAPVRLGGAFWIAIAMPLRDDPSSALTLAICAECASSREAAHDRAMIALRRIWPDARPITLQSDASEARH